MTVSDKNIIKELKNIVGEKNASDDPTIRFAHTRDQFVRTRGPDYVVIVSNKEEISEILKLAYEHKIPVIPKATGANISGAVIPEKGGIILDVKKMDKILEIDKENMTATIEPGVSMGQLQIEAWKHGLFVPEPSGPHVVKVIANLIQCRGISTYSAKYGMGFVNHGIGYEFVLPNGEIIQMGSFANPAGEKSENWPHVCGPDLSGAYVFAFGTLGVCTKAKIKLYPIIESFEGGTNDRYVAIAGPLEDCFKILKLIVKYDVYKNIFLTKWPYLAMLFGQKKKDTQKMMKRSFFEAMITMVLEGSERRINYYQERLKKIIDENFKKILVGPLDKVQGTMMRMTSPGPHSMLEQVIEEPRRLVDFMFLSARAFRVHGAFGGNTPLLALDDAYEIFQSTKKAATEYAPRPYEIACYFQPVDDYHYALQEMDLYFDNFDPVDSKKSFAGHQIGSYYSILRRRDCLIFYIYFAHDFNEAVMPLLAPGYMRLLKNWKTLVDPHSIMNHKKGILADEDYYKMEVK